MAFALVALGANLGDRAGTLDRAMTALASHPGVHLVAQSAWKETVAVGGPANQPVFLNGVALWDTSLPPREFLQVLRAVETRLGRSRMVRWEARTLDLDLLLYDECVIESPELIVPHPRMAFRRFVLASAVEAAPHMRHPLFDWTVAELWEHLNTAPNYLALASEAAAGIPDLAASVAELAGVALCADPTGASATIYTSASDVLRRELGVVRARAGAIAECLNQWPQGVVSDFWLEQSMAIWETSKPAQRCPVDEDELASVLATAPKPKLLAFLSRPVDSGFEPQNGVLRSLATRPGRGPYLIVQGGDLKPIAEELAAAMIAMR